MKNILSILFLFIALNVFAASRYWIGGGTTNAWNSSPTTNWSATSGGTVRVAAPTSSDDVFFDGVGTNANTASTISATITVLSLTFTSGYTNTVTASATLTIAGNFTDNTAHSWAGSSSMTISATSTITSGGKTWPNGVTFSGTSTTKTLSGNWTISGALALSGTTALTLNWTTNETLSCVGITSTSPGVTGTAKIILTGGTWSGSGAIQNNMDISGNVTVSGTVAYNTGTITYASGTPTTTGSTLIIAASTTLNTNGITWNNITISVNSTQTINSLLTVSGTLTINSGQSITFAGSSGFTVATFTCSNLSVNTHTFKAGVTYTITTALNAFTSRTGSILTFTSDDGTLTAALNLSQGASCNVLANFTRITNSGRPIWTFNGTVTGCSGIFAFNDIGTRHY